jgi:hypothetical protein
MLTECPTQLSLKDVLPQLERAIAYQTQMQVTDPAHPDHGALFSPGFGLADPKLTEVLSS